MKQFFNVLFFFVFVSSLSFAQNQPSLDNGAYSELNPKPHIINQTIDTPLEEVFGLNQNMFGPAGMRGRGNIYLCTTPRKLVEHRMYLNPGAGTNLWFVVYEGSSFNGTYNLVNSVNFPNSGPGEGWYSSGTINYDLQAGMYYMIYALFDVNANYWNQQNITPYPINCSFGQLISGVGWNWSPVYSSPPNATETPTEVENSGVAYYQTIVTDDIGGSGNTFFEDFEGFIAGQQVACQDPVNWTTWSNAPCGTEDAFVSTNYAFSGTKSVVIAVPNDFVKLLGNKTTDVWFIDLMVYVPATKSGYFNTMAEFDYVNFDWAMECYFDVGGSGRLTNVPGAPVAFSYPVGSWFPVSVMVDFEATPTLATFRVNNVSVLSWDWTQGGVITDQLAANDFFGAAATDEMYFDNYRFSDTPVPVELTSFTANVNNGVVVLNWETATEINNQGFEIERRTETSEYRTIGFVEGNGTISEPRSYTFTDLNAENGINYYRLKQVDFNGTYEYSPEVELDVTGPLTFDLAQNYPNPFNPSTSIKYSIPESGNIRLSVFNIVGEEVAVLANGFSQAGSFEVTFDASKLSSGVYLYKLQSANSVQTKKMMLLK